MALLPHDFDFYRPYHSALPYYRPWHLTSRDFGSTVHCDKDRFQINLDVQQFKPDEIQVKVKDGCILVEGKHEEKKDEHGYVTRHFKRRYVLPKEYQIEAVASSLSSDGVLTVSAPKCEAVESGEKLIPITHTGPHKTIKEPETKN